MAETGPAISGGRDAGDRGRLQGSRGWWRTGPSFGAVPPELRDREVSVRPLLPLWEAVRAKGQDPRRLAEGTGYAPEHLTQPRRRISWAGFVRFLSNLGQFLGDDELVALGGSALRSPVLRTLLLPGRLLFSVPELYLWFFGSDGPASHLFVAHEGGIDQVEPGRLRFETHMKTGYAPSRENYLLLRGSLQELSAAMGAGPAEVAWQPLPDGAIYDIRVPQTGGALSFLRRGVSWLFAARSTARALRRANADLHEHALELQREVDARTRAEAALRVLNDELEQRVAERTEELAAANRELSAFSYSVSHDLRTPLRGIDGLSQMLIEDYAPQLDQQARDYLNRIRSAAQLMARLIDDLLQLARVTRAELRREPVDLAALARRVLSRLRERDPGRAVEVVLPERLMAQGDARLLEVALENLLGNAWKFTGKRAQARIEVGTSEVEGATAHFVRDNGAGFDMIGVGQLFQPFHRLHREHEFEGTGIGLATVQRIIGRHGGRIWAVGAVDQGATIFFTLPAPPVSAERAHGDGGGGTRPAR
jgi:signal transduction histidine kinase